VVALVYFRTGPRAHHPHQRNGAHPFRAGSARQAGSIEMKMRKLALTACLLAIGANAADIKYQKPPKAVLDVFNAPLFPVAFPSPPGDPCSPARRFPYPPIWDLAKPMLRLAGLRIDPTTNGEHHAPYWTALSLKKVADSSEKKIPLPPNARPSHFLWSADGKS